MSFFKDNPVRDKKYRDWVESQPCMICSVEPAGDCHHGISLGYGEGGMGTKACDLLSMPLCREHHQQMHRNSGMQKDQWRYIAKTLQKAIKAGVVSRLKD